MDMKIPIQVNLPAKTLVRAMFERCLEACDSMALPECAAAAPSGRLESLPVVGEAHPAGGTYAGMSLHEGKPCALILIGTHPDELDWEAAKAFAKEAGGELPNRHDALVLWERRKTLGIPEDGWTWTSEPTASDSSYAWVQHFDDGGQYYGHVSNKYRARAVRRMPIQ